MYEMAERDNSGKENLKKKPGNQNVIQRKYNPQPLPTDGLGTNNVIQFLPGRTEIDVAAYKPFKLKAGIKNAVARSQEPEDHVTFGVELEVLHQKISEVNDSIQEARGAGLTDASSTNDVVADDKWKPVSDSSLTGDSTAQEEDHSEEDRWEDGASVEWVSPILCISEAAWRQIDQLCGIITRHNGWVNDSCSEHIHLGHKPLNGVQENFDAFFQLYLCFQDIIDIFARGGRKKDGEFGLRENVEGYAESMNDNMGDDDWFWGTTADDGDSIFRAFTPEELDRAEAILDLMMNTKFNKNIVYNEDYEEDMADKLFIKYFVEKYNNHWNELDEIYTNMGTGQDVYAIGLKSLQFDKNCRPLEYYETAIDMIRLLRQTYIMKIIYDSYYGTFCANPTTQAGRYRAVNVYQNFSNEKSKPTIEIRRFNGTIDSRVIQANVLLSTLIMKKASDDREGVIDIKENVGHYKTYLEKSTAFIEFLTEDKTVRNILLAAFANNLNQDEGNQKPESCNQQSESDSEEST